MTTVFLQWLQGSIGFEMQLVWLIQPRLDWFRNATGLVDPAYWRGILRPRLVLHWYGLFYELITLLCFEDFFDWFQMIRV